MPSRADCPSSVPCSVVYDLEGDQITNTRREHPSTRLARTVDIAATNLVFLAATTAQ